MGTAAALPLLSWLPYLHLPFASLSTLPVVPSAPSMRFHSLFLSTLMAFCAATAIAHPNGGNADSQALGRRGVDAMGAPLAARSLNTPPGRLNRRAPEGVRMHKVKRSERPAHSKRLLDGLLGGLLGDGGGGGTDAVTGILEQLLSVVEGVLAQVTSILGGVGGADPTGSLAAPLSTLTSAISDATSSLSDLSSGDLGSVNPLALQGLISDLLQTVVDLLDQLNGLGGVLSLVEGLVSGLLSLVNGLLSMLGLGSDLLNFQDILGTGSGGLLDV